MDTKPASDPLDHLLHRAQVDPYDTALMICGHLSVLQGATKIQEKGLLEAIRMAALLETILQQHFPDIVVPKVEFTRGTRRERALALAGLADAASQALTALTAKQIYDAAKESYSQIIQHRTVYRFAQHDIERIQTLLNELRTIFTDSEQLEEQHKYRLLRRLEKLQEELHKKLSNLDRFWGLLGDAGIAIREFGENSKPIVDRIREIVAIIWRVQSMIDGLPPGTELPPLLPSAQEDAELESDANPK